jgi:hypothetical protein
MKALKNILPICLLISFLSFSCKEDKHGPLNNDSGAPGPVRDVQVENKSGESTISYKLPDDPGLLYVKAEYTVNGKKREAKASFNKTSLVVDGFGASKEYDVTLYAVSRSEKSSSPITVKVHPLTPAIIDVKNSLALQVTFGGINVNFANPNNGNIIIQVLRKDSVGGWEILDNYYTKETLGNFSVRGQEVKETTFGVFIKDRWDNRSDTITAKFTPLFEELIPKTGFRDARFPSEPTQFSGSYTLSKLWDDNLGTMYHTPVNIPQPFSFTFDLGVTAKLSRYKIWQRQGDVWAFGHGNPHKWELWGSNNPASDGSYTNWILLGTYIMEKPSGNPSGVNTAADYAAQKEGQEYSVPDNAPAVRFLRWKHIDNWSSIDGQIGFVHIAEINIWGKVQ